MTRQTYQYIYSNVLQSFHLAELLGLVLEPLDHLANGQVQKYILATSWDANTRNLAVDLCEPMLAFDTTQKG
jgi:hypothetical protein